MTSFLAPTLYCVSTILNVEDSVPSQKNSFGKANTYWRGMKITSIVATVMDIFNSISLLTNYGIPAFKIMQIALQLGTIGLILAEAHEKGWKKEYGIRILCNAFCSSRLACEMPKIISLNYQPLPPLNHLWHTLAAFEIAARAYLFDKRTKNQ